MSRHGQVKTEVESAAQVKKEVESAAQVKKEVESAAQVKKEVESAAQVKKEVDSLSTASSTKGKRGRKKKDAEKESSGKTEEGAGMKQELITDHLPVVKKKRKIDRFNGMPEEEVLLRLLPDRLAHGLDILIIGINPGLFAAYIGHHYAGPGNHFWKCLYLSGLVPEPMNCYDDIKLLQFGIGFTNMCTRTTRGSADLNKKEIVEGGQILKEKLKEYKPKIAVFNGKGIYEVFSGSKKFTFGKQPGFIEGTESICYVMPSSSARCAQLPRAIDKVPFYEALGRLRDYVVGRIPHLDESTVTFPTLELKTAVKKEEPAPNGENPDSGGRGEEGAASQSDSGPPPVVVKKEKTTRSKGRGKKQGAEQQEQSSKDGAASSHSDCLSAMRQAYCQEQPAAHGRENQPTFFKASQWGQNSSQVFTSSPPFQHHALTSPGHHAPGPTPGANGVFPPSSMVDFTSLPPAGHNSAPHPTFLSGFSTSASRDFMSGFYAGSQPFGMVGFPNAVASQQPNGGTPTTGDWSQKEPVKIKSEPVDLDSQH